MYVVCMCESFYHGLPSPLACPALQQFVLLLHTEDERESWVSAIKKLQPKGEREREGSVLTRLSIILLLPPAVKSVTLSPFELQDLLSRQTINDVSD